MAKKKNVEEKTSNGTGVDFNSILKDLIDVSGNEYASIASEGMLSDVNEYTSTGNYLLNAQISGSVFGGLPNSQILTLGGESGVGKTFFSISIIKNFQEQYKDNNLILIFDSENAINKSRLSNFGIDNDRVMYYPIHSIMDLKSQITKVLQKLNSSYKRGTIRPLIVIDSVGNLPSSREIDNAIKANDAADFTRAKELRSLFRIVTQMLSVHGIPLISTTHTYTDVMCLTKGHKVKTKGLFGITIHKDISKITKKDSVLTIYGWRKVEDVFEYTDQEVYEIQIGDDIIKCTGNHKFLVKNDDNIIWKMVKDISINDEIIFNK